MEYTIKKQNWGQGPSNSPPFPGHSRQPTCAFVMDAENRLPVSLCLWTQRPDARVRLAPTQRGIRGGGMETRETRELRLRPQSMKCALRGFWGEDRDLFRPSSRVGLCQRDKHLSKFGTTRLRFMSRGSLGMSSGDCRSSRGMTTERTIEHQKIKSDRSLFLYLDRGSIMDAQKTLSLQVASSKNAMKFSVHSR